MAFFCRSASTSKSSASAFSVFLVNGNHTGVEESLGIVEKCIEYPFVIIVITGPLAPSLAQPPIVSAASSVHGSNNTGRAVSLAEESKALLDYSGRLG